MPKTRVLVVDDAVVMRRLLTEVLQRDPQIEVVGTAPNGRVALQKLTQVNPDLVTLDVEMPDLDGVSTLRELRLTHPRLPVIMLSALTRRGGQATLDSLAAGANDYVTKPSDTRDLDAAMQHLAHELLQKIRIHCPTYPLPAASAPSQGGGRALRSRFGSARPFDLVVLATSTGGPNALADFFGGIRARVPVPVAIVQHMPPMFTQLLAARLNALPTALRCQEAADGDLMLPGHAYLAPGGRHLAVTRDTAGRFIARLRDTVPENSCRPAADVLFRSAVETGAHLLGVVLTGMGQDGMRGSERIVEQGGEVIAQDQATSVVWGMPGSVVQAGLADKVLPLAEIAGEVLRRLRTPQPALS
jgi:two-component system chemotaxis response regulator CheB